MKKQLHLFANYLAKVSIVSGRLVSWLTLGMVVLLAINVLSSWLFKQSSILVTEAVSWLHSANFLMAAAYTLNRDSHVRVDIFYGKLSIRGKATVDLLGTLLLLLPVCVFILWSSWSFVLLSWNIGEVSAEAGGMPATYILKSFLLVMPVLLIIEALHQLLRCSDCLINSEHDDDSASNVTGGAN
jgi:TRAP-type mannitol/chloroaromatic compound transport system permease small subunit